MTLSTESAHAQLAHLVQEMPQLYPFNPLDRDQQRWLGRALALIDLVGSPADYLGMITASQNLEGINGDRNAGKITTTLFKVLATLELKLPMSAQGAFIPVGNAFDALNAIGKILGSASQNLLIVDPYMDGAFLQNYATFAREKVPLRLLTDRSGVKPSLRPAVVAWDRQYGSERPIEARATNERVLHDRLIVVDAVEAYILTQSFNGFAVRSHASIARSDKETALLKIQAYGELWASAAPITS